MKIQTKNVKAIPFIELPYGSCFRVATKHTNKEYCIHMKAVSSAGTPMAVSLASGSTFCVESDAMVIPVDIVGVEQ